MLGKIFFCSILLASFPIYSQTNVAFTIDLGADQRPISPLIYGANGGPTAADGITFFRSGGNRLTGYNWENNASNAGTDYGPNSSDAYLGNSLVPGFTFTTFHDQNLNNNAQSLITLQAAGYVAADKNGVVSQAETAPSSRWRQVAFRKGGAFSLTPDITDGTVSMDEAVNFLVNRYGPASGTRGVRYYSMDNEPALWPSTHPRIHPGQTGAAEVANRNAELARAVKAVDPSAKIYGGVFYGYAEYMDMQTAPDWSAVRGSATWYVDYFLDRLKRASDSSGMRLLDAVDFHWYPEARGDCRIIMDGCAQSANQISARLQAPRSLWDSTYVETSWIAQAVLGNRAVNLIPRIFASINRNYPGTNISFSEVTYGAENHVSGGLAMADFLGVAGRLGLLSSNFWPLETNTSFVNAAYRLYRNYDGLRSVFGSITARASSSDNALSSVFTSFDPGGNAVHIIVINKSQTTALRGNFTVASPSPVTAGRVFGFENGASAITEKTAIASITGNTFTYDLPPLSARHFILQTSGTLPIGRITDRFPHKGILNAMSPRALIPTGRTKFPLVSPDGRQAF